jgi:tetratricopeptide (TPR) repeat protein
VIPREQEGSIVPINPSQDSLVVSRESKHAAIKTHSLVLPRNTSEESGTSNDLLVPLQGSSVPHTVAVQQEQKFKAPQIHFFSQEKKTLSGSNSGQSLIPSAAVQQDSFAGTEPLAGLPLSFPAPPMNTAPAQPTGTGERPPTVNSAQAATPEIARMQALEERLFSRSFDQDNPLDRISRLERFVLGVEGKGELLERLNKLNKIFKTATPNPTDSTADSTTPSPQKVPAKPKALLAVINDGIDNYNKHRFHNAEDDFNDALALAPGMSRVHAYLGVTLLQLNQRQAALDAMNAAYELDPFGTYGRYAKQCLITLMGDEEVRKRGPKDDLKTVEKTLNSVNHQADTDSNRYRREGNIQADHMRFNIRDSNWAPNDLGIRRDYIHTDWTVQSTRVRQDAAKRAEYAQESANNLKMLLSTKLMPGDAKLRALGTTLHARYYGDETYNLAPYYIPREAPLELKAQPLSLKALHMSPHGTVHNSASQSAKRNMPKSVPQKGSRSNGHYRR